MNPFCGSASVFYNLISPFNEYVLNDLDPNIISIHKTIKLNSLSIYKDFIAYINENWPDLKDKDIYYDFS